MSFSEHRSYLTFNKKTASKCPKIQFLYLPSVNFYETPLILTLILYVIKGPWRTINVILANTDNV